MMSHVTRERPVDYISKIWNIIFGVLLGFILLCFLSASLTHPFSLLRPIYRFTGIDTNNNEGHLA